MSYRKKVTKTTFVVDSSIQCQMSFNRLTLQCRKRYDVGILDQRNQRPRKKVSISNYFCEVTFYPDTTDAGSVIQLVTY